MSPFDGERGKFVSTAPCTRCEVRREVFCGALDAAEIDRLLAISSQIDILAHATLFVEGGEAEFLFNVTSGIVKRYKLLPDGRRQITGFLFPGDFLGIAIGERYICTAEAVGPVSLCRFSHRRLAQLMVEFPRLQRRLLDLVTEQLATSQEQVLLLGRKSAAEKVASFLVMLSRRAVAHGQPASPVSVPMRRTDIAEYLGLTIETVSRVIGLFKRRGLLSAPDSASLHIENFDGLGRIAEGS